MANIETMGNGAGRLENPAFVIGAFAATLFASAFLLFGLQPLFAKLMLPALGGSSAVWSFALVFFQSVLLAGYGYAHLLAAVPPKRAMGIHAVVLAAGFAALPVGLPQGWAAAAGGGDPLAMAAVFGLGAGLPFFAVSATAPLLQSWYSRAGQSGGTDPYFLYGASNLGSFLALAAYPFVIEPLAPLSLQISGWTAAYAILAGAIILCGGLAARNGSAAAAPAGELARAVPGLQEIATWAALAAVPSGLLVSVTAHISTDVVAAPFLWAIPLALFLLTFVIVFHRRPLIGHSRALWLQAMAAAPFAALLFARRDAEVLVIFLHLAVFFISAMVCHGTLASLRPPARHLTAFYLAMSFGGVIGGLFASIIAPQVFSRIHEYPILLAAAFACRGDVWRAARQAPGRSSAIALAAAVPVLALSFFAPARDVIRTLLENHSGPVLVAITLAVFALRGSALRQAAMVAAGIALVAACGAGGEPLFTKRSPFGVHTVERQEEGAWHVLKHGTTSHGAQRWMDANGLKLGGPPVPAAYYYPEGPMGAAIAAFRKSRGAPVKAAIIGLGSGALACHQAAGETWRFFEIDQAVIDIARDPNLFTYLEQCAPDAAIVLGDGRLKLVGEPDGAYDLIVVDAFSSDSIPVHLLTREAMALYRSKLAPGGMVMFHISNRFMKLEDIVAATARGLVLVNNLSASEWPADMAARQYLPKMALSFARPEDGAFLAGDRRWHALAPYPAEVPWTDDYSNVLGAILSMQFGAASGRSGPR